jgi:hypothetical protein
LVLLSSGPSPCLGQAWSLLFWFEIHLPYTSLANRQHRFVDTMLSS